MKQQYDPKNEVRANEVRAAIAMREIAKAQRSISGGPVSMFMRAILVLIFMYMTLVSFQAFGVLGPVFISILFIIAVLSPVIYQAVNASLKKRRKSHQISPLREETPAQQKS